MRAYGKLSTLFGLPLVAALGACSGDEVSGPAGSGGAASTSTSGWGGTVPHPPLDGGSWQTETVGVEPVYASGIGLAYTADGTAHVVWGSYDGFGYRLQIASRTADGWLATPLDAGTAPTLAAAGNELHLGYGITTDSGTHIRYAHFDGEAWHEPIDLTAGKPDDPWHYEWQPEIAARADGKIAVVYDVEQFDVAEDGYAAGTMLVRVDDDAVVGEPEPVAFGNCYDLSTVFDAAGVLHVAGSCGNGPTLVDDASGVFQPVALPLPLASAPVLALAPNGQALQLAFRGYDACEYLGYARGSEGVYSPTLALEQCNGTGAFSLATDRFGRGLIGFVGAATPGSWLSDVLFTYYEQGAELAPATVVESLPQGGIEFGRLALDPTTDLPAVVYSVYDSTAGGYRVVFAWLQPY